MPIVPAKEDESKL
jgi:hypothetical protein